MQDLGGLGLGLDSQGKNIKPALPAGHLPQLYIMNSHLAHLCLFAPINRLFRSTVTLTFPCLYLYKHDNAFIVSDEVYLAAPDAKVLLNYFITFVDEKPLCRCFSKLSKYTFRPGCYDAFLPLLLFFSFGSKILDMKVLR